MNMIKTFATFEEGIEELRTLVPEVKDYVGEETDYNSVIQKMMEKISGNIPAVQNPEYPAAYAFSISATEVGFKTRNYSSFGWRVLINGKNISYSFRYTVASKNQFAKPSQSIINLKEAGWAEPVRTERK